MSQHLRSQRLAAAIRFAESAREADRIYQQEFGDLPVERDPPFIIREATRILTSDPAFAHLYQPMPLQSWRNKVSVEDLPTVSVSESMLGEDGTAECAICRESVARGETVTMLACRHWFMKSCLEVWLRQAETCPCCRRRIVVAKGTAST